MPDAPAVFRQTIARHNRHVALVAIWSVTSVAVLWALVYFGVYWLVLLVLTLGNPFGATAPATFPVRFGIFAALFLGTVFLEKRIQPHRRPRDRTTPLETAVDLLLALPRATLTSVENLRAFVVLNRSECALAWSLLQRLQDIRRLSLAELPLEIPSDQTREKIIRALQILDLIELREYDGDWTISLRGTGESSRLLSKRFKLKRGASR